MSDAREIPEAERSSWRPEPVRSEAEIPGRARELGLDPARLRAAPSPDPEARFRRKCFHEAGHAVAATACGWRVERVVASREGRPFCQSTPRDAAVRAALELNRQAEGRGEPIPDQVIACVWAHTRNLLGGLAAEAIAFDGEVDFLGGQGDFADVAQLARQFGVGFDRDEALRDAVAFLRPLWGSVCAVQAALLEAGELSGDDVRAIMARHPARPAPAVRPRLPIRPPLPRNRAERRRTR